MNTVAKYLLSATLVLELAGTARGSTICTVTGRHSLRTDPYGPVRGTLHAGPVRVTELGSDCKGRDWAHVGGGWLEQKYLSNCDLSKVYTMSFCE